MGRWACSARACPLLITYLEGWGILARRAPSPSRNRVFSCRRQLLCTENLPDVRFSCARSRRCRWPCEKHLSMSMPASCLLIAAYARIPSALHVERIFRLKRCASPPAAWRFAEKHSFPLGFCREMRCSRFALCLFQRQNAPCSTATLLMLHGCSPSCMFSHMSVCFSP